MKKIAALVCSVCIVVMLASCSAGENQEPQETPQASSESVQGSEEQMPVANNPEDILNSIQSDFESTIAELNGSLDNVKSAIGETFDGYVENEQMLLDWYEEAENATQSLGERTVENGRAYFKAVAATIDHEDSRALEDALDSYYDAVYEDAYEMYYDAIYEDAYEAIYDAYYDGILSDAYDSMWENNYDEWSDVSSDCYKYWSRSMSDVYKQWSRSKSDVYSDWSDVNGGFLYSDEFDVDALLGGGSNGEPSEEGSDGAEGAEASNESKDAEEGEVAESSAEGVEPEFKSMIDEYEAFFDEYVEFMNMCQDSDSSWEMSADYANMMAQYSDTMEAMSEVDGSSLSKEELAYYTDAQLRINEKLSEIQ